MRRIVLLSLLALYLIVVGLWVPAAVPVSLLLAGMTSIGGLIPGPAWLLAGVAAWLYTRHRSTPVARPATA